MVASAYFAVEIENVAVEPKGQFFNYITEEWQPSPYPIPAEKILKPSTDAIINGTIVVPIPNLINHLNKLTDDMKKRSRVIFSPGLMMKDDIPLRFRQENGIFTAKSPVSPKPFVPVNGPFGPDFANNGQFYRCRILNENEECIFVEVLEIFGRMRIGMKYSPNGYIPENRDAINNLADIPQDMIMPINKLGLKQNFEPAHFDNIMFYDLVKIFTLIQTRYAEVSFGWYTPEPTAERPLTMPAPVSILRNVRESGLDPQITIVIAGLRQDFGAQRR
jgi:hypothetical protein